MKKSIPPLHTLLRAEPLNAHQYAAYGAVVEADSPGIVPKNANQGTAQRYNHVGRLENLRPKGAVSNLCVFRCKPREANQIELKMLERHPWSTQLLIPMGCARRYLVVVCLGKDKPDLTTLRAFIARKDQGITYAPGTWHHPLIALDETTDFACVVYEDETQDDCEEWFIETPIQVTLSTE